MELSTKAKKIRAVILDVDGVLTDGRIGYSGDENETKFFDVRDGLGIKLLQRAGIKVGVLSGRASRANRTRFAELKLNFVIEGSRDKGTAVEELAASLGFELENLLYMGDDLIDLPAMRRVGVAVAVGDAVAEVKERVQWTTRASGGRGAVREAAVWLLKEQGLWDGIVEEFAQR